MSNALNPFMAGRQMGVSRPYAQIKAGGGMSPAQFNALNLSNTINPRQVQLVQSQFQNIDPASDVRRQYVEDRSDLRQNMINQANALEGDKQRDFQAEQGALNRASTEKLTDAQLRNAIALEDLRIAGRKDLQDDAQAFTLTRDQKLADQQLKLAGVNNEARFRIAQFNGEISRANTTDTLRSLESRHSQTIDVQLKDLNQRLVEVKAKIASSEKIASDRNETQKEIATAGNESRERMATQSVTAQKEIAAAGNESREKIAEGRLEAERARIQLGIDELTHRKNIDGHNINIKKAELELRENAQQYSQAQRIQFGQDVARAQQEYADFRNNKLPRIREQKRDQWIRDNGFAIANANPEAFVDADGNKLRERIGASGRMNPLWMRKVMEITSGDQYYSASFKASVDDYIQKLESEHLSILAGYQRFAASAGIPMQPIQSGGMTEEQKNRLSELRAKRDSNQNALTP